MNLSEMLQRNLVTAIALKSAPLSNETVEELVQLLPLGWISHAGIEGGKFLVDELSVKEIIANFNSKKNEVVFDYEHQTVKGGEAPASGWHKELIDKGEEGLWARVDWTPRARNYIENKEYRYVSPVVLVRQSDKRAFFLHSSALTNDPNIDGMKALNSLELNINEGDDEMDFLAKARQALGLPDDTPEEKVLEVIKGLIQQKDEQVAVNNKMLALLSLPEGSTAAQVNAQIMALQNNSGFATREELKALQEQMKQREKADLVTLALNTHKITPAQKPWAEKMVETDPEGFKLFLNTAVPVVPTGELKLPNDGGLKTQQLDDAQIAVNKLLGISNEDFQKHNTSQE